MIEMNPKIIFSCSESDDHYYNKCHNTNTTVKTNRVKKVTNFHCIVIIAILDHFFQHSAKELFQVSFFISSNRVGCDAT